MREDLFCRADLDDTPRIQNGDTIGDLPYRSEVMTDEHERQVMTLAQAAEQIEDLIPQRHIESRDRLVEHHDVGLGGKRPQDAQPLALAARELMRQTIEHRLVQFDRSEQVSRLLPHPFGARQSLSQRLEDRQPRIEGLRAVLKDQLQPPPAPPPRGSTKRGQVRPFVHHAPLIGCQVPHEALSQGRLATTRLPHQSKALSGVDLEIDLAKSLESMGTKSLAQRETLHQSIRHQDRSPLRHRSFPRPQPADAA